MSLDLERFNLCQLFVSLCYPLLNFLHNLIDKIVHMCSSFTSTDTIHKGNLSELSFWNRCHHLPSLIIDFLVSDFDYFFAVKVEVNILHERVDFQLFFVEKNFDTRQKARHIIDSLPHQGNNIIVKFFHAESFELWVEGDWSIIFSIIRLNFSLTMYSHISLPDHSKFFPHPAISTLNDKLVRKDIGQFSSISISTSNNFFLIVIVVASCQQVSKDEFRNIDVVLFVNLDWNAFAIIHDTNKPFRRIDHNFELIHFSVSLIVISCIH